METSYADGRRLTTWDVADQAAGSEWQTFAATVTAVRHPALVQVLEATATGSTATLVVEAEVGEPVDSWVGRRDATVPDRLAVLRACASALDALHAGVGSTAGTAHGDLRPPNLLVRPDESAVLTGFSPWVADADQFTAPELAVGARATTAGDAYAFARLTAEVLIGPMDDPLTDANDLVRRLRSHPRTRRRPKLVAAIRDVLSGPPETRPRGLQAWLTEVTEGTVTGGVTAEPTRAQPVESPRRHRFVILLAGLVAIVGATAAALAFGRDGTEGHSHAEPAPLAVGASWYPADTCFDDVTSAGTAMRLGGRPFADVGRLHDVALDRDGGRWGSGLARLSLTAAGQVVQVTAMTLKATSEDAPNWVLVPPRESCRRPPGHVRHWVLHLDDPWALSVANWKPGLPRQPELTVQPGSTVSLAVEAVACEVNREWQLEVTYYLPGKSLHKYHALSPPLRLYSVAEPRTQAFTGSQTSATLSGDDPRPTRCPL